MRRLLPFPSRPLLALIVVLVLTVWMCGSASARRRASGPPRSRRAAIVQLAPSRATAARPVLPSAAAGAAVALDSASGAHALATHGRVLRLLPAEQTGLIRNATGLPQRQLTGGGVMLDLQGRFREFAVVRIDSSGHPDIYCVHAERILRRLLDPAAPAPARAIEER